MLSVELSKEYKSILKLTKEWSRRAQALRRGTAYDAANHAYATAMLLIPTTNSWAPYRASLRVAEVATNDASVQAYAVYARPKAVKAKDVDPEASLICVKPRSYLGKVSPAIKVLDRFGPWAVNTLPFAPPTSEANITYLHVNKGAVDKARRRNIRDRKLWRTELVRAGVRDLNVRAATDRLVNVMPDVTYAAYKLEFGIGIKAEPHWRPAIRQTANYIPNKLARSSKVSKLFLDLSFTGWRKWEKIQTDDTLGSADLESFRPFQKRLGVR